MRFKWLLVIMAFLLIVCGVVFIDKYNALSCVSMLVALIIFIYVGMTEKREEDGDVKNEK